MTLREEVAGAMDTGLLADDAPESLADAAISIVLERVARALEDSSGNLSFDFIRALAEPQTTSVGEG